MGWAELKTKLIQVEKDLTTDREILEGYGEIDIVSQKDIKNLCEKIEYHINAIITFSESQRAKTNAEECLEEVSNITAASDFKKIIFRDPNGKITHIVFESASLNKKATMYPDERDPEKKYVVTSLSTGG